MKPHKTLTRRKCAVQNIERRIAALEVKSTERCTSFNLVVAEVGETQAAALERTGFVPDAADVMCVVFVKPNDASLWGD